MVIMMATIHQLTQYLFGLNHQANAARVAWFNYNKNHCEGSTLLTPEVLNRFLCRALTHQYWQNHRTLLATEVFQSLEKFFLRHSEKNSLDFTKIHNPETLQIITVDDLSQWSQICKKYVEMQVNTDTQIESLNDGKRTALILKLFADKTLQVQCFENIAMIQEGELIPLCEDLSLFYEPHLELSPRFIQHISVAPHTTSRFIITQDLRLSGSLIRDHSFQKYDMFTGLELKNCIRVFFPIKKLEQFYINPKTEPYYQELVGQLEKIIAFLKSKNPNCYSLAKSVVDKAKMAADSLYPSDKALPSLINESEKLIGQLFGPKLESVMGSKKWELSNKQEELDSIDT